MKWFFGCCISCEKSEKLSRVVISVIIWPIWKIWWEISWVLLVGVLFERFKRLVFVDLFKKLFSELKLENWFVGRVEWRVSN